MEKLQLQFSGESLTSTGIAAVVMLFRTLDNGVTSVFRFKPNGLRETIEISWPSDSDVALMPNDIGSAVVSHGYARYLTGEEVERYNELVEQELAKLPPVEPTAPETGEEPAPASETTPPVLEPTPAPEMPPTPAPEPAPVTPPAPAPVAPPPAVPVATPPAVPPAVAWADPNAATTAATKPESSGKSKK